MLPLNGNPNPGNVGSDFARFDMDFWSAVKALDARNQRRQDALQDLNEWRNAIAHQDWAKVGGSPTFRLRTVRVWRGGWVVLDPEGKELPKEPAEPTTDHWQNWLDCVKSRQQPRSNLASMAQTTMVCHLANCSLLARETVHWSKEKMDIVGAAGKQTSSYYREYRKPWHLPMHQP